MMPILLAVALEAQPGDVDSLIARERRKLEALQEAQRRDMAKLKTLRRRERTLGDKLLGLEREVALLKQHIRTLKEEERRLTRQIDSTKSILRSLRTSLLGHRRALGRHLRILYIYGRPSLLKVLLTSEDITEFWRRVQYVKAVEEWERIYSEALTREMRSVQKHSALLKARLEARRKLIVGKRKKERALKANMAKIRRILTRLRRDRKAKEEVLRERRRAIEESQRKIESLILAKKVPGPGKKFVRMKGKLPWPVEGPVAEKFGRHRDPQLGTWTFNRGIGIKVPEGTVVRAVADGKVILEEWLRGYGQVVLLDHGGNFFTLYGGLKDVYVGQGQDVKAGEPIGTSGRADALSPPMLHFEILEGTEVLDPTKWLKPK